MRALSDWLVRVSTGWLALAAVVGFLLFTALVLPAQPRIETTPGTQVSSPDLSFWYSAEDLYRTAEAYGADGREAYVRQRVTFDVVWPLVYVAFLGVTLSWVAGRLAGGARLWQRANLLPVAAGLFDYLENACTVTVMLRYPARAPIVGALAPVMSATKWTLLAASFVLLFAGTALVVWRGVRARLAARAR